MSAIQVFNDDPISLNDQAYLREAAAFVHARLTITYQLMLEVGGKLYEVKQRMSGYKGFFNRWVTEEFGISPDTATNYMNVATRMKNVPEGSAERFGARALYQLSTIRCSQEARDMALLMAGDGKEIDYDTAYILSQSPEPIRQRFLNSDLPKKQTVALTKSLHKAPAPIKNYCIKQNVSNSAVVDYLSEAHSDAMKSRTSPNPRTTLKDIVSDAGTLNGIGWSVPLADANERDIQRFKADRQKMHVGDYMDEKFDNFTGHGVLKRIGGTLVLELVDLLGLPEAAVGQLIHVDLRVRKMAAAHV